MNILDPDTRRNKGRNTRRTPGLINSPTARQITDLPDATPEDNSPDRQSLNALGDSPLRVTVRRLRAGLDALARAGHLRRAELAVLNPACPCFLLDVAPGLPRLYVEMFLDDSPEDEGYDPEEYDPEEEWRPLLVLMNWLGEDTDPAIFELDPSLLGSALAPVLDHVLWMTQARLNPR